MVSNSVTKVLRLREAGNVERCHTLPHADTYSVGKHVYDMLALLVVLHPNPSAQLFRAIVYHDAHERWTGDIPGALKYLTPDLARYMDEQKDRIDDMVGYGPYLEFLTADEKKWLKALDRIEFFLWCEDQVAMGNRHISGRLDAVIAQLESTPLPDPCQLFLRDFKWHRTGDNDVQ